MLGYHLSWHHSWCSTKVSTLGDTLLRAGSPLNLVYYHREVLLYMQGRTHLALGIMSGIILSYHYGNSASDALFIGGGCIVGSILPDIDSKTSIVSKKMPVGSFFTRILCGHRGMMHTPFNLIILWTIFGLLNMIFHIPVMFMLSMTIGYLLHLIQDSFTKRGIMWLYPFKDNYYRIMPLKSGYHPLIELSISVGIAVGVFSISYLFSLI